MNESVMHKLDEFLMNKLCILPITIYIYLYLYNLLLIITWMNGLQETLFKIQCFSQFSVS